MQFKYLVDENENVVARLDYASSDNAYSMAYPFIRSEGRTSEIISEAKKITFEPNDIAIVSRIVKTDDEFEYDCVELGLNINIPTGRTECLRYYVELYQDDIPRAAIIFDGFPKDKITEKEKFKGAIEIKLGVSKLLKFIPYVGTQLDSVIDFDLKMEPINIVWMSRVLDIGFSGPYKSKADWWINGEDTNIQDFKCCFTMWRLKSAEKVTARVHAVLVHDPSWHKRSYGRKTGVIEYPLYPRADPYIEVPN